MNYADDLVICCRGTAEEALAGDAGDDGEAEADGERGQDAGLPAYRKSSFDFLGYTFGRCYSTQDGPGLSGHAPVEEEHRSDLSTRSATTPERQRLTRRRADGGQAQSDAWAGPTTSVWGRSAKPTGGRRTRPLAAASVVMRQAPGARAGIQTISRQYLYDALGLVRLPRGRANLPWAKA